MGATEEQIAVLSALGVTHVAYILLLFSVAFLLFLFVCILLHIYAQATWPIDPSKGSSESYKVNGGIQLPDTPINVKPSLRRVLERERDVERARAVEEFELEGLMSEEEDENRAEGSAGGSEDSGSGRRKEGR